ncbi:hypothetical protein D3C75_464120 [compost metagenome]
MKHRRGFAFAIDGSGATGKRQQHQGVFQALGFVHSDDLDQVRIAFQAQNFLFALPVDLLGQMADQRMFAIEFGGAALQPFGQMQQVGQAALALILHK